MANVRDAIRRIENSKYARMQAGEVMAEFENAGILESMTQGMYRFKYGYYRLCEKISGQAHGMPLRAVPGRPNPGMTIMATTRCAARLAVRRGAATILRTAGISSDPRNGSVL